MTGYTPNYAFPYPSSTDKPKDAPAQFQALATAMDAALKAAGYPPTVADTGWVNLIIPSGFVSSSSPGQCRRIGHIVYHRGSIQRSAGVFPPAATVAAQYPSTNFRPARYGRFALAGFGSTTSNGLTANITNGSNDINVQGNGISTDTLYLDGIVSVAT